VNLLDSGRRRRRRGQLPHELVQHPARTLDLDPDAVDAALDESPQPMRRCQAMNEGAEADPVDGSAYQDRAPLFR
jgi:hypothetical protein